MEMLAMATEYEISSLKTRCEQYLDTRPIDLATLELASRHNLKTFFGKCAISASQMTLAQLRADKNFNALPIENQLLIFEMRLGNLEKIDVRAKVCLQALTTAQTDINKAQEGRETCDRCAHCTKTLNVVNTALQNYAKFGPNLGDM